MRSFRPFSNETVTCFQFPLEQLQTALDWLLCYRPGVVYYATKTAILTTTNVAHRKLLPEVRSLLLSKGKGSKLDPEALKIAVQRKRGDVHSVQPSVVSISQATESGSVYTVDEIREISRIAKSAGLRVHMDGARFANALDHLGVSPAEMTWKAGVDVLSFGFTKNGAMTVDAIVSFDSQIASEIAFRRKRSGHLASKMRFHTSQIDALLTDGLWLRNARQANEMAARLGAGLSSIPGPELLGNPEANILFCRLSQNVTEGLLAEGYNFYHDRWGPGVVRFVTSFSHACSDIDELIEAVRRHYARSTSV